MLPQILPAPSAGTAPNMRLLFMKPQTSSFEVAQIRGRAVNFDIPLFLCKFAWRFGWRPPPKCLANWLACLRGASTVCMPTIWRVRFLADLAPIPKRGQDPSNSRVLSPF
jgi:hypothetical protein